MSEYTSRSENRIISIVTVVMVVALVGVFGYRILWNGSSQPEEPANGTTGTVVTSESTTNTTQPEEETIDKVALPDVSYAVVGEPIVIRFLNITSYNSLDDISVSLESGGKGKVYADRWEYTPQKAETISLSFTVTDKNGDKVNESTHTIEVKQPSQKKELSVLVIGDSTIAGGYETKRILDLANSNGHKLTLLGTRTTSYVNDDNNRHEGRGGWKAVTYVEKAESSNTGAVNEFYNPVTETFDFGHYMKTQGYTSVDCVCLQLGINDIFGALSDRQLYSSSYIDKYFKNMDIIIESIHAYDPNIKIVWNLILPGSVEQEKFELAYKDGQTADRYKRNTYLTNLEIIKHVTEMENVYVAPTNSTLNTVENMYLDGGGAVHPARKGYYQIGEVLYSYIYAICE